MGEHALKTFDLCKTSRFSNVNLKLESKKIYGLIGSEKSGKSALIQVLCGLSFPSSGSYELLGETTTSGIMAVRRKIGIISGDVRFYEELSVQQNFIAQGYALGIKDKSFIKESQNRAGFAQRKFGRQRAKHLSKIERARLAVALAFLGNPELLLLNEPFAYLDKAFTDEVIALIFKLNENQETTILFTCDKEDYLTNLTKEFIYIENGVVTEPRKSS